jgi:predicted nuclease of predicted toxin-antitoxin system
VRFLLDESAEARIVAFLANLGHDARRFGRDYPAGLPDQTVLAIARSDRCILITNDRDFGESIFQRR